MKFDDVLTVLGDFGHYQKLVFIALCLPIVLVGMQILSPVFTLATPSHRYDMSHVMRKPIPRVCDQLSLKPTYSSTEANRSLGMFLSEPRHDKSNKMAVRPSKTQISLGIHPVWSESSLCAQWVAKDPSFLHADSEDSDQTGRIRLPSLIWVFAGRTCHFVGFVMRRLISQQQVYHRVSEHQWRWLCFLTTWLPSWSKFCSFKHSSVKF